MTDEPNEPLELTDFATFEAEANAPEAKEPEAKEPEPPVDDDEADPNVNDKADDPEADDTDEEAKPEQRRSKPAKQRIGELVAKNHEKDREIERLRAQIEGKAPAEQVDHTAALAELEAKRPSPDAFEFGEADTAYIEALTDWKMDVRDAKRDAKDAESGKTAAERAQQQQVTDKLNEGMASVEKAGAERYDDFQDKIEAAVEARGGEPLPPLVSIGIAVSPAGADIAYRLATDPAAADKLEKLAGTDVMAAALLFGEHEGEFIADDDSDLALSDPVDMMRLNGRMKARLKGLGKAKAKIATDAPTPATNRARGASGQFEAGADTSDFAAFERREKAKARG